jgi:hypothetical protein
MQGLKEKYSSVKFRTEEPNIQLYADNIDVLKSIAQELPIVYRDNLKKIVCPENDEAIAVLTSNKILVKTVPKYQFKVILRDGQYPADIRKSVLNYINGLDELVRIPASTRRGLSKQGDWLWSGIFYTNDPNVVDFVRLISPNMIGGIYELVCINK